VIFVDTKTTKYNAGQDKNWLFVINYLEKPHFRKSDNYSDYPVAFSSLAWCGNIHQFLSLFGKKYHWQK